MANASSVPKPRLKRLLLLLPILLVVAVLVNWDNIVKIARGEKSLKSVIYGLTERKGPMLAGWKLPPNSGAADAKIVIEVFLLPGDPCHIDTAFLGQALGTVDPQRIRVTFRPTHPGTSGAKRRDELQLGCEQGLAINGQTKFRMPDPSQPGKQRVVYLSHEGGAGPEMLYAILDQELKKAYKGKGMPMSAEAFVQHLQNERKRIEDKMMAEAKAREEAEKQRR